MPHSSSLRQINISDKSKSSLRRKCTKIDSGISQNSSQSNRILGCLHMMSMQILRKGIKASWGQIFLRILTGLSLKNSSFFSIMYSFTSFNSSNNSNSSVAINTSKITDARCEAKSTVPPYKYLDKLKNKHNQEFYPCYTS